MTHSNAGEDVLAERCIHRYAEAFAALACSRFLGIKMILSGNSADELAGFGKLDALENGFVGLHKMPIYESHANQRIRVAMR